MEGSTVTDAEIREAIDKAPASRIDFLIGEYIHDERNQRIARAKLIRNEKFEPLSESVDLTPKQCRNIIRKARRIIYEHL